MTSADGGSAEDGEESPDSDSLPEPAPMDAAAWRAFFAGTSARDTWQVLQKEKVSHARIFAGFRPAPAMLKSNPVVMTRLVDEAVKFPAFAKAVREISAPDGPPATTQSEEIALAEANPAAPDAAANRAAEDAVRVAADALAAREKIKELRSAAGVHIARIKELEAALVRAERDRDTARTEAANHETARRTAETETRRAQTDAEKQKRERERAARRAEMPVAAPNAAASAAPTVALPTAPQTPERLLYEAGERLLLENRFAPVAELCREALRLLNEGALPAISIGERGRVHGLYAGALYGLGDAQNGEHYDRLAATAFLDGGDFIAAAEAMARRFGQGESGVRAADVPILRRLTLMSRKASASEGVQAVFHRLRITAPSAFRRLQEAAGLVPLPAGGRPLAGGALFADLIGINGAASGTGAIGPDEIVSLTPAGGAAAAVTGISPRQLAQAVDAGDSGVVLPVRAALAALRSTQIAGQSDRLADAFLEAVSELSPVAVCPLLAGPQIKLRQVLVDASNVARYNPDPLALETPPRVRNLRLMRDYLLHRGYFPVTLIADANLRFHVDDKPAYLALVKNHIVREAPPAMTADEILIREANDKNAPLITNDRLSEWGEAARRIERVGFLIAASGISLTPF